MVKIDNNKKKLADYDTLVIALFYPKGKTDE
jgi:hypothetical protein